MIFRRAKDIVDVYALAHCVRVCTSEIFAVYSKNPDREVGAFDELYNRRQDVEHSYEKLRGIEKKPPFDEMYAYIKNFIRPFAERDRTPRIWDNNKSEWYIYKDRKPSLLGQLDVNKKIVSEREAKQSEDKTKRKSKDEESL